MLTVLRLVPENLLRKQLRLDRLSIAEVTAALTAIPLTVGLAWSGAGVWALVGGNAATWLVQFGLPMFRYSGLESTTVSSHRPAHVFGNAHGVGHHREAVTVRRQHGEIRRVGDVNTTRP